MLDKYGEPTGLNMEELESRLHVNNLRIISCLSKIAQYGGFNRTWGTRLPEYKMYKEGGLFKLEADNEFDPIYLRDIENSGLGIKKEEGYGRVLFLGEIPKIEEKAKELKHNRIETAEERMAGFVLKQANKFEFGLSNSQLAEVEKIALLGDEKKLYKYLENVPSRIIYKDLEAIMKELFDVNNNKDVFESNNISDRVYTLGEIIRIKRHLKEKKNESAF